MAISMDQAIGQTLDCLRQIKEGPINMAMAAAEIESLIKEGVPDAQATIEDLRGDGDH